MLNVGSVEPEKDVIVSDDKGRPVNWNEEFTSPLGAVGTPTKKAWRINMPTVTLTEASAGPLFSMDLSLKSIGAYNETIKSLAETHECWKLLKATSQFVPTGSYSTMEGSVVASTLVDPARTLPADPADLATALLANPGAAHGNCRNSLTVQWSLMTLNDRLKYTIEHTEPSMHRYGTAVLAPRTLPNNGGKCQWSHSLVVELEFYYPTTAKTNTTKSADAVVNNLETDVAYAELSNGNVWQFTCKIEPAELGDRVGRLDFERPITMYVDGKTEDTPEEDREDVTPGETETFQISLDSVPFDGVGGEGTIKFTVPVPSNLTAQISDPTAATWTVRDTSDFDGEVKVIYTGLTSGAPLWKNIWPFISPLEEDHPFRRGMSARFYASRRRYFQRHAPA